jgi:bacterioferritin-associated ferredoxin
MTNGEEAFDAMADKTWAMFRDGRRRRPLTVYCSKCLRELAEAMRESQKDISKIDITQEFITSSA